MTQAEYIAQHAATAEKMVSSPEFRALLETAREECPFATMTGPDDTSIVKLAGATNGWFEALKWMKTAHKPKPEPKPRSLARTYEDPSENQHLPTTENKPKTKP